MSAVVSTGAGGMGLSMCLSSDTLNRRARHSFSWVSFYSFPMNITAQLSWVMSYWMDWESARTCRYIHIHVHIYIYTYIFIHSNTHMCTCRHVKAIYIKPPSRHSRRTGATPHVYSLSICVASSGLFWATPILRK